MARRQFTLERVRQEIDTILDEVTDTLDRHHEVRIRVDAGGTLFVDRSDDGDT